MSTQISRDSRRSFLAHAGAAGAVAAAVGVGLVPLSVLAAQARTLSLWPARRPIGVRGAQLPSMAFRVYSKLAFGPRPANPANPGGMGDLDYFNSLGATDSQRLEAWLNEQLAPGADPEVDSRLSGNPVWRTQNKTLSQMWLDHYRYDGPNSWQVQNRPYWETQLLTLTRMVHSRWQLREVLADFWANHFNVDGSEGAVRSVLMSYYRDVIRAHLFGNFRTMLENVVKHAAMMYYLDNARNSTPNPNENYARELLELHTLGAVENYYGFIPPSQVPLNQDGEPAGYVEADVLETARLLTGFGVADGEDGAPDTGAYLFRPAWHDSGTKTILGQSYPGTGESELGALLDYLCQHRGTAEFICWKLAVRLIGDSFTAASPLVQAAADVFQSNWTQPDQLSQVYRALILSSEFQSTWGDKVRRPTETVAAVLRAVNAPYDFELNSAADDAGFYGYYWTWYQTSQLPYSSEPPTGYAESASAWKGTGPLIMSWRTASLMLRDVDSASAPAHVDLVTETNAAVTNPTPNAIVDWWLDRIQGPGHQTLAAKRTAMVDFVRVNGNATGNDQPLGINTSDNGVWSSYQQLLRGLVLMIALLPERMIR